MNKTNHEADNGPDGRGEAPRLRHPDGAKAQAEAERALSDQARATARATITAADWYRKLAADLDRAAESATALRKRKASWPIAYEFAQAYIVLAIAEATHPSKQARAAHLFAEVAAEVAATIEAEAAAAERRAETEATNEARDHAAGARAQAAAARQCAEEAATAAAIQRELDEAKGRLLFAIAPRRQRKGRGKSGNYPAPLLRLVLSIRDKSEGIRHGLFDAAADVWDELTPQERTIWHLYTNGTRPILTPKTARLIEDAARHAKRYRDGKLNPKRPAK